MWTKEPFGDLPSACGSGPETARQLRNCPDNEEAWSELIRRFHPFIVAAVARTASRWGRDSRTAAEDLIQETYLRLCAQGPAVWADRRDGHAALGLLRAITHGAVNDHFKALIARKRGGHHPPALPDAVERAQSTCGPPEMERAILLEEIDSWLLRLNSATRDRDRAIFWLYYRDGLTARAIAALPFRLTLKGIERLLARLTGQLRVDFAHPRGRIGLPPA